MDDPTTGDDWAAPGGGVGAPDAVVGPALGALAAPSAAAQYAPPAVVSVTATPAAAAPAPTYRSWQPGIIPLRPVSFGEFLAVPFKAMRYNRAVVIGGPLLCVAVSILLLGVAMWLTFTDPSLALLSPTGEVGSISASTVAVWIAAAVTLVLADALACAVVAPGVARAVLGERIGVGAAFRAMWPRIGGLLLLWLLSSLAIAVALAPGLIAVIFGSQAGDDAAVGLGLLGMLGLGLIVGLPVYIVTAITRCVIVLERTGAIASIRRTLRLIRGRFWWSVLIIGVTAILVGVVTSVLQNVLSVVALVAFGIGASGGWLAVAISVLVLVIAAVATYVFTYSYMGSVYALVYIDARIRHEGFDMDLARAAEARRG